MRFGLIVVGAAVGGLAGIYLALFRSVEEGASISDPSVGEEPADENLSDRR